MEGDNVCLSQGRGEAKDMGIEGGFRVQDSMSKVQRAERAFKRAIVYELFSYAFGEPDSELLEFIRDGGFSGHLADALTYHPYLREGLIIKLRELKEEVKGMDIEEMLGLYSVIASREKNLLYEGNYHHPFNTFEEMADIAGFYRAFGLDFSGERPDHLCLELEFMRILCLKEAKALLEDRQEQAEICISAEAKFLSSHTGRWTEGLMKKAEGIRLYSTLTHILERWIEMELRLLSASRKVLNWSEFISKDDLESCIKEEVGYEGIQ